MQCSFASLSFPSQAARRLSSLLPALSSSEAQDWTAQVYGYKDWSELCAAVGTTPAVGQEHLDKSEARRIKAFSSRTFNDRVAERSSSHVSKLCELVGWTREAAEDLFSVWAPSFSGQPRRQYLANLGNGTPAFSLMQQSLFPLEREEGGLFDCDGVLVYEGFTGPVEKQRQAATRFVASLPKKLRDNEGPELIEELCRVHAHRPDIKQTANHGEFMQVREMSFFAVRDNVEKDIVGFASATFAFIASSEGSHSVKISINRVLYPVNNSDIAFALSDGMSTELWRPVSRYLWCAIGNPQKDARVDITYPARHAKEKNCVETFSELIAFWCGWPNADNRPERYGIHFNLVRQP